MEIGRVEQRVSSVKQAFLFAEQRKMQIVRGATVPRNAPSRAEPSRADFCRYFLFRENNEVSRKFENYINTSSFDHSALFRLRLTLHCVQGPVLIK